MSSNPSLYIENEELASIIKNKALVSQKDYIIFDVRDDDFEGGNIPGAYNLPSRLLSDKLFDLVKVHQDCPLVIFHCALSQVRGPKAARLYKEARSLCGINTSQRVSVLRGGFAAWQAKYRDDPLLVENFDIDFWS
ncbi:uncharacterized protein VTP21DRAFT_6286 [Calcarisporiella thermophila]|uniref:uncharacterized protein n=1 Tax=Calcarisporiella thermophila TaxID=911321 RepID=UPI0037437D59